MGFILMFMGNQGSSDCSPFPILWRVKLRVLSA